MLIFYFRLRNHENLKTISMIASHIKAITPTTIEILRALKVLDQFWKLLEKSTNPRIFHNGSTIESLRYLIVKFGAYDLRGYGLTNGKLEL